MLMSKEPIMYPDQNTSQKTSQLQPGASKLSLVQQSQVSIAGLSLRTTPDVKFENEPILPAYNRPNLPPIPENRVKKGNLNNSKGKLEMSEKEVEELKEF